MPPMPRVLRIGPMRWALTHDAMLSDAVGETLRERLLIRIRPGQAPDYEADTVLHEVIHACLIHVPFDLDHETEERVCLALAPALLDTFRRNPKLVAYLLADG